MTVENSHEKPTGTVSDAAEWMAEALIDQTDDTNRRLIIDLHERLWPEIVLAPGSSHNHQAWPGGYREHIKQVNHYVAGIFSLWVTNNVLASLSEEEQFTLPEALTVTSLHDIEKLFKLVRGADGTLRKNHELVSKQQRDDFKLRFLGECGIVLTSNQVNAMRYVEGMGGDYTPHRRVMSPMAVLCHTADILSARGSFNLGNPTSNYPLL